MKPVGYKTVMITQPAAIVDNASFTTAEIDTKGFRYARVTVALGATDVALTALKVTESDTAGSGHADVTGLIFGTSNNDTGSASTLPSGTDDNKLYIFLIDLRGRKRYLDFVYTIGDGTVGGFLVSWIDLHEAETLPVKAADFGAAQVLKAPVIS
jgi:hypothetical protein